MSKDELQKETTEELEEETTSPEEEEETASETADETVEEEEATSEEQEEASDNEDGDDSLEDDEEDGDDDEEEEVVTEKEGNENEIVEEDEEGEDEDVAETSDKKSPLLVAIFVVLIITIVILLAQRMGGETINGEDQAASVLGELTTYENPIHGFSLDYPDTFQLIATDSIPAELAAQGISSMEMMGLSDGDALLVQEDSATDNIVYTILALSNQPLFTTTDEYVADLKANLEASGDEFDFEYAEREVAIGEQDIDAFEFSFEMEVPGADGQSVRQGAFFDTIFEHDGTTYSISFGYPKDIEDSEAYLSAYEALLSSIDFSEEVEEEIES